MSHRNDRNDRKAPQCGAKISVLSVLSVGQKYSFVEKPMTAGQKIERSGLHGIRGDSRQGDCL